MTQVREKKAGGRTKGTASQPKSPSISEAPLEHPMDVFVITAELQAQLNYAILAGAQRRLVRCVNEETGDSVYVAATGVFASDDYLNGMLKGGE